MKEQNIKNPQNSPIFDALFFQPFLDCPDAVPKAILIGTTDWKENSNLPPNMPHCGFRGELDICKVNGQRALVKIIQSQFRRNY